MTALTGSLVPLNGSFSPRMNRTRKSGAKDTARQRADPEITSRSMELYRNHSPPDRESATNTLQLEWARAERDEDKRDRSRVVANGQNAVMGTRRYRTPNVVIPHVLPRLA